MTRLTVTVILATYNRANYIGGALDSILSQSHPPLQVIVVDDGSTDGTQAAVQSFGSKVDYIHKENGGKSSALNLGLGRAIGDCIWIFDDDDVAAPGALEHLVAALAADPDCGFAYGPNDAFHVAPGGAWVSEVCETPPSDSRALFRATLQSCVIFQAGMLVRKHCYDTVGPFNEQFVRAQDYEMLLRLVRRFTGVFVDQTIFHQRRHAGIRGSAKLRISDRNRYRVQRRYDQDIFAAVHRDYALSEYLYDRQADARLSPDETFTALVERASIMARKGLWTLAADDLAEAVKQAPPTLPPSAADALARVFDPSSIGLYDFAEADAFHAVLGSEAAAPVLSGMRAALSRPLLRRLPRAVTARRLTEAASLAAALMCIAPLQVAGMNTLGRGILKFGKRLSA